MNQIKTGELLRKLRKEKGLTQEQLAERFGVSRRTVSRWETASNMPDLSILVELADFYDVDIREILDGERKSESMTDDMKETILKVSEYSDFEKKNKAKKLNILFAMGLFFILLGTFFSQNDTLYHIVKNNHVSQGLSGVIYGMGISAEVIAFYYNSRDISK